MRYVLLLSLLIFGSGCAERGLPEDLGAKPDQSAQDDSSDSSDGSDTSDPSDATDASDTSDPSDATDATDASDPSDASDVSEGVEPTDAVDESDTTDPEPEPIDPACDLDFDGEASVACGGTDCDDLRPDVGAGAPEICDFVDNNCDTEVNEYLDCAVYAVSDNELLKIDPFFETVEVVSATSRTFFDIDTDSSGRLFGITGGSLTGGLYEYEEVQQDWTLIGRINPEFESPNGLAITQDGQVLATGMDHLYILDPVSGYASTIDSYQSDTGDGIVSSGDCVVSKENGVFMTSSVSGSESDRLVRLSPASAVGEVIGDIGFGRVWGLSSIEGQLFGFTNQSVNSGSVIMIDGETGEGTFLFDIPYGIYGAASRAGR